MARGGHRYPLVLYAYTFKRWWKLVLWIGIFLLVLTLGLSQLPLWLPQYQYTQTSNLALWVLAGTGILSILAALFLVLLRGAAYVRPFPTHLRLSTPLLGFNISYKRIRQATTTEMQRLFPLERYKGWRRKFLRPLGGQTAVVIEMNGWPVSPALLKMFLSPFFFPDRTPRLALLVTRWMEFSTEMESYRGAWLESQRKPARTPQSTL